MKPTRILTDAEVISLFGDPGPFIQPDGSISREWETGILTMIALPGPLPLLTDPSRRATRLSCHRRLAPIYMDALEAVYARQDVWSTIGDWGGCYAFRANRKAPRKLSRHSWGIAHDWDVLDNPQGSPGEVDPDLIEIMEGHGFYFGGRFQGDARDPMHWEFAAPWLLTGNGRSDGNVRAPR